MGQVRQPCGGWEVAAGKGVDGRKPAADDGKQHIFPGRFAAAVDEPSGMNVGSFLHRFFFMEEMAHPRSGGKDQAVGVSAEPGMPAALCKSTALSRVMSTCISPKEKMPLLKSWVENMHGVIAAASEEVVKKRPGSARQKSDMPDTAMERGPGEVRSFHHPEVAAEVRIAYSRDREQPLPTVTQMLCQCFHFYKLFIISCFYLIL